MTDTRGEMVGDLPISLVREMIARLSDFPANGKPPNDDATMMLIATGLIERQEITKPCRECGTPRPDYSYFRVTAAGKLFLAVATKPLA